MLDKPVGGKVDPEEVVVAHESRLGAVGREGGHLLGSAIREGPQRAVGTVEDIMVGSV